MLGVAAMQPGLYLLGHGLLLVNFQFLYLFPDFGLLAIHLCWASLSLLAHLHQNNTLLVKVPQWWVTTKSGSHRTRMTDFSPSSL